MRGWRDCRGDDERELATSYDEYGVESIFSGGLGATTVEDWRGISLGGFWLLSLGDFPLTNQSHPMDHDTIDLDTPRSEI